MSALNRPSKLGPVQKTKTNAFFTATKKSYAFSSHLLICRAYFEMADILCFNTYFLFPKSTIK